MRRSMGSLGEGWLMMRWQSWADANGSDYANVPFGPDSAIV